MILRQYPSLARRALHQVAGPSSIGSAKLFADALHEETTTSTRDHLRHTQGPIWEGEESTHDAVLRMLVDSHKPLRTGQGVKHDSAVEKMRQWMKEMKRTNTPHRTTIPPHLHRPWHATYTGSSHNQEPPRVKYGSIQKRKVDASVSLLELPSKSRAKVRAQRRVEKIVGRVEKAKEGALDYKLGLQGEELVEDTFTGKHQLRGRSALGAQQGGASGLRAWAGLVEDRIQRARDSGFFDISEGRGQPIPRDPEADNPHIEGGELIINRIIKRQGALPPWIELQDELDAALTSFRSTLLQTYTTHLSRTVMSTQSLHPLPPLHAMPSRDEAWEARELKFHQESIRQLNDLIRRMNTMAPSPARRNLTTLENELARVRGSTLREEVFQRVKQRSEQAGPNTERTGSTRASGVAAIVAVGLGVVGVIYYRLPLRNDSMPVPTQEPTPLVAPAPRGLLSSLRTYILEPILTLFRFCHLVLLFGPVILTAPMLLVGRPQHRRRPGKPVAEEEESWGAIWWYAFLVKQMERAGPSFIKLGQWAASRADLFPAGLCNKMSKLHSNGKPHSLHYTKRVIERAFELSFDEIFQEFGEQPIGCGAIAQVYKAKLRPEILGASPDDPSTSVAIKVLHPRARKTIRRDIAIMSIFANAINALPGMEWLSLPEEVAVFGGMMNSQLDLRVEASNLDRFDDNFRDRGRRVTFPRPIRLGRAANGEARKQTREVLMEEYEDALPLKYFLRNGGGPFDDKIANIGLDAFLEMLLLDNWTHGDLHPGNIMVRFYKPDTSDYMGPWLSHVFNKSAEPEVIPHHSTSANELVHNLSSVAHDPDEWLRRLDGLDAEGFVPQLIFIDAGLVTSLDGLNRRNFLDLFQAVAEFDGYKAGKLMVERCRTPEHVVDEETFALKMQHLVLSVKSKTFSLAKIKISDILTDVLTSVRQHHVKLEGDFVNTVISILLLEGIGRQLDPNMDLFKSALPILRQLGRQMGTRDAITAVPKGNIWAMAKLWIWVEAREVAGEVSSIDDWIKYDRLAPAM